MYQRKNGVMYLNFYKISEFSKLIGVSTVTLRSWERRGWLLPHHKSPSGYRYYSKEQVDEYLKNGICKKERG